MPPERLTEFRRGDLVFDVIDSGPVDGTPVVLLHGFPQRATAWGAVAAHLHERGARTYAPDQRGYSPRARPRSRFAYRTPELFADVRALVDAIGGGPVHVVGHDWGAAVAWGVAATYPESVSSLTVVSVPHPQAFVRSLWRSSQLLRSYYILFFQLPWLPEWTLRGRLGERLLRAYGMPREMIAAYKTDLVEYGAIRGGLGWYRSLAATSLGRLPGKVTVPTTLVWSDADGAISRKSVEMSEPFVEADYAFEIMTGARHWIPELHPAELSELIAHRAGLVAS